MTHFFKRENTIGKNCVYVGIYEDKTGKCPVANRREMERKPKFISTFVRAAFRAMRKQIYHLLH